MPATIVSAVVLAFGAADTFAQDLDVDRFTLRGFGSLAATWADHDDVAFRRFVGQPRGVDTGDVELYTDSIAGAQVNARINADFSATVQGLTRMRADGDWDLRFSQAYLRYSPDDSWLIRAGRIGFDIYLLAESRQVGFSYLAMRPAPEMYGMISGDDVDGGDVVYTHRAGRGLIRARLFGGESSNEVVLASGASNETDAEIYGLVLDYLYRGWTARAAFVEYRLEPDPQYAVLAAGLRMTGVPQAVKIADGLGQDQLAFTGLQLGLVYDDGPFQAQLLYANIASDSIGGPDVENFYAQFGYRLRQWTPFLAYADANDKHDLLTTGLPDLPMFAPLNGGVQMIQQSLRSTQHTTSLGVRYDFSSHFDFKLQVDRISIADSTLMLDRRFPPGGPTDLTVIAAGVDFVF